MPIFINGCVALSDLRVKSTTNLLGYLGGICLRDYKGGWGIDVFAECLDIPKTFITTYNVYVK